MKRMTSLRNLVVLLTIVLLSSGTYAQQLTTPMRFQVNSPGTISGEMNYGYPIDFGPTTISTVTGDVEWVYDISPDSLACDSIADDLTGKIALIRRGACSFGLKVYNAQVKGAIGCIIVNNTGTTEVMNMSGNGSIITIPSVMISYNDGLILDSELSQGNNVNVSFYVESVHDASLSYAYSTPLSRVIPHENMRTNVYNSSGAPQTNVSVTLDITDPLGAVTNFTTQISSLADGDDSTAIFPGTFTPTMIGTYYGTVKSSLNPNDSVVIPFEISDEVWALDNDDLANAKGVGPTNAEFANDIYEHHRGAIYQAVPVAFNGDSITASFALENAAAYVGETFSYVLYTPDYNVNPNFQNETDYSTFITKGVATHTITAADAAAPNILITEALLDPISGNLLSELLPDVDYMLVVKYEGNGSVVEAPKFTYTHQEDFLKLDQVTYSNQQLNLGGWTEEYAPVMRLNLHDCGIAIDTGVSYVYPELIAQESGAQYQWVDCNNGNAAIPGETGQSFTPTVNGSYAVVITVNGCTRTSGCTQTTLGLDDVTTTDLKVQPNPTKGLVYVSTALSGEVNFTLLATDGRKIESETTDSESLTIDLSNLQSGVYILHVQKDGLGQSFRIVKE